MIIIIEGERDKVSYGIDVLVLEDLNWFQIYEHISMYNWFIE